MKLKYAAIVTYGTGVKVGATITAKDLVDAWAKLLKEFEGGKNVAGIKIVEVLDQYNIK